MAIPPFLAELRALVGTRPLWLPSVTAVVLDEQGRVLLNKRKDDGRWALVGGILDPGEQPAVGVVRECLEETGVTVEPELLVWVGPSPMIDYASGDQCQYLELVFRCRPLSGEAKVNDDESLEVRWFGLDALPPLDAPTRDRLDHALARRAETAFELS